ncbi:MAG TPA: GDSL-type esterase/lipase family protein [Puia sp.]|jgi:sialidase-1
MKRINKLCVLFALAIMSYGSTGAQSYFSTRGTLDRFYMDVLERKTATVGFLGGSITYNPGWRDKVCGYLQERFPETKFRFIAAGIPSLGSLPHAFRVQQDLLDSGRVDLVFVETAVNDRVNGTDSLTQARALEGIVRHIKRANRETDIIMMAFADEAKTADYDRGLTPVEIANQERVADYYHLPSINLGKEVWDRIRQGKLDWKRDFKDVHPSEFGQELYFATIRRLLDSCYKLYRPVTSTIGRLAAPMDGANLANGRYVDVHKGVGDKDWKIDEDWVPADNVHTRPGFVHVPVLAADKPGAELEFPFTGNAVGIAAVSGPDAGIIEYSIDGGTIKKIDLYTQWSNGLHLPWYLLLGSGLTGTPHKLRIRISDDRDPKSKGTACRIVHFLLNTRS